MPIVTRLEEQKRKPDRFNLYLDGEFAFGISAMVVATRHLVSGTDLTDAEVDELRSDESTERAYNAALNFLSFRPRSEREMLDYFRRKGYDEPCGLAVLDRLTRAGLIDDAAFARFWVENRQNFRPRGALALRTELRAKGVTADVIETALESLGDEFDAALQAGRKRWKASTGTDATERRTKIIGHLQRRGFTYATASRVYSALADEMNVVDDSCHDNYEPV